MKMLVFGPSGAGKTYVSRALKQKGINAFDDNEISGLSNWYDSNGNKVIAPSTAQEALDNHYSFLWSKKILNSFLNKYEEVYVFGGSGNLFDITDLFDKVYFLKVELHIQKERILNSSRETPFMDFDEKGIVVWGAWLEQEAAKRNIPFVDATLTPEQIFSIISK